MFNENKEHTFITTGNTLGRLMGRSNPLRASSANAKHPPCQEPSPFIIAKSCNLNVKVDTRAYAVCSILE